MSLIDPRQCAVVVLFLLTVSHSLLAAPADEVATNIDELDQEISDFLASVDTPGAAVAVVEDGELVLAKGYGLADVAAGRPMTADTILRAGSLSKNITSLAALRLASTGRLDLNAKLSDLLPDFEIDNPWAETDPIRVSHLLEHTAGIEGSTYFEYGFNKQGESPQEYADLMSGRIDVRWPPGWYFSYANPGHTLVALIIERACACTYDEFVKSEIFEPLGMSSSTFLLADVDPARIAKSYRPDGVTESSFWLMAIRPSGSLLTTAEDLGRLVRFYATRGASANREIVAPRWLERMENQETSAVARAGMVEGGYGFGNFGFFAGDGHIYHGHAGSTDGYRTWLGYDPDHQRGFAIMLNGESSSVRYELRKLIATYLTRDYPPTTVQPEVTSADLASYAGWYAPFTHDMPLRSWLWEVLGSVKLKPEGNRLLVSTLRPGGMPAELVPVGNGLFRTPELPIPTAAVLAGPDGDPVYINGEAYRSVSRVRALALPTMLLAIFVIAVGSIAYAVFWVPMRVFGKLDFRPASSARFWVLLSSVSFVALIGLFIQFGLLAPFDRVGHLGHISVESLLLMLLSILGALTSVIALWRVWRSDTLTAGRRLLALAVAMLLLAAWTYLASVHWVPLITFLP